MNATTTIPTITVTTTSIPRISDRNMLPLEPTRMLTYHECYYYYHCYYYYTYYYLPRISDRKMLPLEPTRMLTDSTTSRKISFLRYLMPSLQASTRQGSEGH